MRQDNKLMIKPKPRYKPRPTSEAGYTILEGIMAIVVVTVLLVAISPMIGFAAAVRMQAKRTQLASQAARSYMSFVKTEEKNEDGEVTGANAPGNQIYRDETDSSLALAQFDPPEGGDLTCDQDDLYPEVEDAEDGYCGDEKLLYCVNFDETAGCQNDSPVDMIVQPIGRFRIDPESEDDEIAYDRGYELAVRVYQANAFKDDVELRAIDGNGKTETTSFMARRDLPLVQMSTSIAPQTGNQFATFCEELGCD